MVLFTALWVIGVSFSKLCCKPNMTFIFAFCQGFNSIFECEDTTAIRDSDILWYDEQFVWQHTPVTGSVSVSCLGALTTDSVLHHSCCCCTVISVSDRRVLSEVVSQKNNVKYNYQTVVLRGISGKWRYKAWYTLENIYYWFYPYIKFFIT